MKHALVRLGWLITTQVEPIRIKKKSFNQVQLKSWTDMANREYDNICLHLLDAHVGVKDETALRSLFHRHQSSLVNLMNRVFGYQVLHPESPLIGLYNTLMKILEELWDDLKDNYAAYFDPEGKVPDIYQQLAKQSFREELPVLHELMARHQVNAQLIALALKPVDHCINCRGQHVLTNRCLTYLKALTDELTEWANSKFDKPEWELLSLLIYLDLNSRGLRSYCFKFLSDQLNEIADTKGKLLHLEDYYNKFHILLVNPDTILNPKRPTLKHDIEKWLTTEIALLEKRIPAPGDNKPLATEDAAEENKKLKTPFSVIEEAVWAMGLKKVGKILNSSMIEIFRIVANSHEAKQQQNMSADSMQKHYNEIDVNSLDMMMGMAMELYNYFKMWRKRLSG